MKTTQKHFQIFRDEILRLIDLLGFKDFRIDIEMEDYKDDTSLARIFTDCASRSATFQINAKRPKDSLTDEELIRSARHEIGHLFTADLRNLAYSRFLDDSEIEQACESFARRFEKLDI